MPEQLIIKKIRCFKCGQKTVVYDGTYWCEQEYGGCGWVLPDIKLTRKEREWYALAYVRLMEQRHKEPKVSVVQDILGKIP